MSTVDEILSTGRYTDRRGRKWFKAVLSGRWESPLRIDPEKGQTYLSFNRDTMRLLIERDQHECHNRRDGYTSAMSCMNHPVPVVFWSVDEWCWLIRPPRGAWGRGAEQFGLLPAAMDAARALAVGA